jgi:hypothetical protein
MVCYDDSQWKANVKAFRDYLAAHQTVTAASIEQNRKEAERLKAEQAAYIERRRIENPYLYGRYLPNKKPLPLLASKPIEETPRRLNMEALSSMAGVNKRKKAKVLSPAA